MAAQYLFRLDDACPWHDRARWHAVEQLFTDHDLHPLVAVIPDCKDPAFLKYPVDADFWARAKSWQEKGWTVALHGLEHIFHTHNRGLVPFNAYSEFAGMPLSEQEAKIELGYKLLVHHGLRPQVWVAPAHSFDRNTLLAINAKTPIRIISDGLSNQPFSRFGFSWIPQQLWRARELSRGVWTICLHPNEMTELDLSQLQAFLQDNRGACISWQDALASQSQLGKIRPYGLFDRLFSLLFLTLRRIKRYARPAGSHASPQT